MSEVDKIFVDATQPSKHLPMSQLSLEAESPPESEKKPEEAKPPSPNKLGTLGVGIDVWPWEKPAPAEEQEALASKPQDNLIRDIVDGFGDTRHRNPLLSKSQLKATEAKQAARTLRTSVLGDSDNTTAAAKQPDAKKPDAAAEPCDDGTPNCNKLQHERGINVNTLPWNWGKTGKWDWAGARGRRPAQGTAQPARKASRSSLATAAAGGGMRRLGQRLRRDALRVEGLRAGEPAAAEERLAQDLETDAYLMSRAMAHETRLVKQARHVQLAMGLDPTGVACHRGLGTCGEAALNASAAAGNGTAGGNETGPSAGFGLVPGSWPWLPGTAGQLEKNGVNTDSWPFGALAAAEKWQRSASQELKADSGDMAWLANADAAAARASLKPRDRLAWQARLGQQLEAYADKARRLQWLDEYDGCSCWGSGDEDRGPRCSCTGQPAPKEPSPSSFSPSEVTTWRHG